MKRLKRPSVPIGNTKNHGVVFSQNATHRLVEQALYIFEKSGDPDRADAFLDEMNEFIQLNLEKFPYLGHLEPDFGTGVRKLVYRGYSILYRIEKERILILTIFRENLP